MKDGAARALLPQFDGALTVPGSNAAEQTLNLHLFFNMALLAVALPLVGPMMRAIDHILAGPTGARPESRSRSALDPAVQNHPRRAFACAQRELVEMGNRVEVMLGDAMDLFDSYDDAAAQNLRTEMKDISRRSLDLRV